MIILYICETKNVWRVETKAFTQPLPDKGEAVNIGDTNYRVLDRTWGLGLETEDTCVIIRLERIAAGI